jgi:hypothetical protein
MERKIDDIITSQNDVDSISGVTPLDSEDPYKGIDAETVRRFKEITSWTEQERYEKVTVEHLDAHRRVMAIVYHVQYNFYIPTEYMLKVAKEQYAERIAGKMK